MFGYCREDISEIKMRGRGLSRHISRRNARFSPAWKIALGSSASLVPDKIIAGDTVPARPADVLLEICLATRPWSWQNFLA